MENSQKFKRIVFIGSDYPELEKYCPHHMGVQKGLSRLDLKWKFVSCRPKLNIKEIVDFKPDLVVYGLKDMITEKDWRKEIREKLPNAVIVIWYGDFRDDQTMQMDADCYEVDAMFVSNDAQGDYYPRKWKVPVCHYLPLGCEPIEEPLYESKFDLPFIFIGGVMTSGEFYKRAKLMANFRANGGLKVINSYEAPLRAKIFRDMPKIYSSAKISLDISHFTHFKKYTSIRYWEIPAFWGFALTKRWPGCEEYYPEDTRAYFDTYDEAMDKVKYYLERPELRKEMVEKAHEISYEHTYDKRFNKMFELL